MASRVTIAAAAAVAAVALAAAIGAGATAGGPASIASVETSCGGPTPSFIAASR